MMTKTLLRVSSIKDCPSTGLGGWAVEDTRSGVGVLSVASVLRDILLLFSLCKMARFVVEICGVLILIA